MIIVIIKMKLGEEAIKLRRELGKRRDGIPGSRRNENRGISSLFGNYYDIPFSHWTSPVQSNTHRTVTNRSLSGRPLDVGRWTRAMDVESAVGRARVRPTLDVSDRSVAILDVSNDSST